MADKITSIKRMEIPKEKIRQDNLQEVLDALADNKDAMLETIRFFSLLHKEGNLAMINAMVAYQETIMGNVSYEFNRAENGTIIKNLFLLLDLLGMLNLSGVDQLSNRLTRQRMVEDKTYPDVEKVGIFDLMKALKDPEVNRVISILLLSLKGVGKNKDDKK
ncbi:DUF1641 domain-containing protein [Peribacillus kribbensis]|uniref:DUF1641 domain-containing protein n=1 Tax=Peribacillus kribbensis TaxID=356658 RepID=UPI0003FCB740|nr:DUF1641 domain-containing protein [Peribacillus kribbensis]